MDPIEPRDAELPPSKRAPAAVVAVLLGAVLVPLAAFLVAGTLLTVGIFVVGPLIVFLIIHMVWRARRGVRRV
jgi:hypothetical protein